MFLFFKCLKFEILTPHHKGRRGVIYIRVVYEGNDIMGSIIDFSYYWII